MRCVGVQFPACSADNLRFAFRDKPYCSYLSLGLELDVLSVENMPTSVVIAEYVEEADLSRFLRCRVRNIDV